MHNRFLIIVVAAVVSFAQGCVIFGSRRVEKIPRLERKLRMNEAPPINLVLEHIPGDGLGHFRRKFEKLRKRFPYLENAAEHKSDADYTLTLRSELVEEKCWPGGSDCAELAGVTFLLIPAYDWSIWRYQATWQDSSGTVLYRHEGRMKHCMVTQLWLWWVLPVNAITGPLMPTEKRMMRRLLALIERDLARDGTTIAISGG